MTYLEFVAARIMELGHGPRLGVFEAALLAVVEGFAAELMAIAAEARQFAGAAESGRK